jgi:hypothetical protein
MSKKTELFENLNNIDKDWVTDFDYDFLENEDLEDIRNFSINSFKQEKKAVLGLDIYRYGSYPDEKQNLLPLIFDMIKDRAIIHIKKVEPALFPSDFKEHFISTGDGGFLIFETPLHALIFALYFYGGLRLYNTGYYYPKLSKFVGEIIIRSVITYDYIYNYNNNFYGKAIIVNSRILSKDKLNRFLVDRNVFDYFTRYLKGIESLPIITRDTVKKVLKIKEDFISSFITENDNPKDKKAIQTDIVRNVHVQKIEDLFEKEASLVLYNLELQVEFLSIDPIDSNKTIHYILTIGNSNTIK